MSKSKIPCFSGLSLLLLLLFTISCSPYSPCDRGVIEYGMSMMEVREILGNPDDVYEFMGTVYFIYSCERRLWIGFKGGAVSEIDEHDYY